METLVFLGGIFILLSFLLFIVAVALYIIFSIGLYQMAKNAGLENSWLAFVPIAQMYIMGKLIKEIKVKDFVIPSAELVLPIAFVVLILCGGIPLIGQLLALAGFVLYLAACYNVYLLYRPHGQVEKEKTQVSQAILDVIPKNPEVKHVKKHMKPAPVQKDGAY